jgi:hypothetical protein
MILINVYFIFLIIFAVTNFFPKYIDKYFFVFIFLNYCSVFIFFEIKKNDRKVNVKLNFNSLKALRNLIIKPNITNMG